TAVLMGATLLSLLASRVLLGHVAAMPIVTAVLVCVFGGLTVWLQDPQFIKMKPTILYLLFSAVLLGGLLAGKILLKKVFGEAFQITDEGWKQLTVRWAVFFVFLAITNEIVWRTFSEQTWVNFKVFGFLPLTLVFAIAQMRLIKRNEIGHKS
ncbi:MAG: septation protein A, partial [Pyrinomonadaceae bacterium]